MTSKPKKNMDSLTKGQDRELNKIASIFYNESSKIKGYFPDDKSFTFNDKLQLLKNIHHVAPTIVSLLQTPGIIKKHKLNKTYTDKITDSDFIKLNTLIRDHLKMDAWGVAELKEQDVFKGQGIPFKHVIVLSKNMDKSQFHIKNLPNMDCQLEVMKIYGKVGIAAIEVSRFIRNLGYAAAPNHGLGGNIDYIKAGMDANLGFIGKHGMLITPENGPCHRLSVVYTNIDNLNGFLKNDQDHSWGYEFCKKCKKCVKSCPYDAIYNKNIIDRYGNVESISNEKCNSGFINYGCGICIGACPFTGTGYKKLFDIFNK